jgi:hypothetical protein
MSEFERTGRIFKVWRFDPSHRQLFLRSDPTAIDNTTTRVEIYFGHVTCMLLKPIYRGIRVRLATDEEYKRVAEIAHFDAEARSWTWFLEEEGNSFVVSGKPSWREAPRQFADVSLFDLNQPWPPTPDVKFGEVG